MKWWTLTLAVLAMLTCGAMAASVDDVEQQRRIERTQIREPFSAIDSLTDEQKLQIKTIRRDVLDQINALRKQERERILEVLTEEQRAALPQVEAELRQRKRDAATQPAGDIADD